MSTVPRPASELFAAMASREAEFPERVLRTVVYGLNTFARTGQLPRKKLRDVAEVDRIAMEDVSVSRGFSMLHFCGPEGSGSRYRAALAGAGETLAAAGYDTRTWDHFAEEELFTACLGVSLKAARA
jgi:hypothetical protein